MITAWAIVEQLLEESPDLATLKKNRRSLNPEEREQAKSAAMSIWKAIVDGKTWYVSNTHRAYSAKTSLSAAIKSAKDIEATG